MREADLEETFARSSGPGGQHVNKVSTAVTLRHLPSGIAVSVQETRSQSMNRQIARERLVEALEKKKNDARAARRDAAEKLRRQNAKRPRGVKRRMVDSKKKRGALKKLRGKVSD